MRRRGFTLTELLCVIGVIAVLIAIFFPLLGRLRETAWRTKCMANLLQLTSAWILYSADHRGALVSANTGTNDWVGPGNINSAVTTGLLYRYVPTVNTYICPSDFNQGNLRSYSINCVLNGETSWCPTVSRMTQVTWPTNTFVFVEEYDYRGYNINSFGHCASGNQWIDRPAHLHRDGCTISFADGHVEYWRFADPRTLTIDFGAVTPNNPDLIWLFSVDGLQAPR